MFKSDKNNDNNTNSDNDTNNVLFIAVYIDDLLIFGPKGLVMDNLKDLLKSEFKVTNLGDLHWLLGIRIEYRDHDIALSQSAYIDTILKCFGLYDCNPVTYSLDKNHQIDKATTNADNTDSEVNIKLYQQMVGSLMYTVIGTRPDITFTVTRLSQFLTKPTKNHFGAIKHVFRYLKGTRNIKLSFPYSQQQNALILEGFTDSDFAGCPDTRRSTSGYIFKLANCAISWRSRKQKSVATSTPEAEYMALAFAVKHYLWLLRRLQEFGYCDITHSLSTDNTGADDLAHNPRIGDKSKHIQVAFHFTRELVENGTIVVLRTTSKENLADICTKTIVGPGFSVLRYLIMN